MSFIVLHVSKINPINQHYLVSDFSITPLDTKVAAELAPLFPLVKTAPLEKFISVGDSGMAAIRLHVAENVSALRGG